MKERLTLYLKSKRLSQREFAHICGISPSVLSRIGEATDRTTFRRIDEHCDLNVDWLIEGKGEMLKESAMPNHTNITLHDSSQLAFGNITNIQDAKLEIVRLQERVNHYKDLAEKQAQDIEFLKSMLADAIKNSKVSD